MRLLSKTSTRPNFLFGLLPHYFKENDNYNPNAVTGHTTEGLLERYFEVFCNEVDSQVVPYIDNAFYLYDAQGLTNLPNSDPSKFLDHIADLFGNPSSIGTELQYKALLRHIRAILQTKGTKQALVYFLALYGYRISSLTEATLTPGIYDLTPTALKYDNSLYYDKVMTFYSNWDLVITDLPGTGTKNPNGTYLTSLKNAIQKFISPIFATLNTVTYV
jgi:hypothetical protein